MSRNCTCEGAHQCISCGRCQYNDDDVVVRRVTMDRQFQPIAPYHICYECVLCDQCGAKFVLPDANHIWFYEAVYVCGACVSSGHAYKRPDATSVMTPAVVVPNASPALVVTPAVVVPSASPVLAFHLVLRLH